MIAGYPVGARIISGEFESGRITKKQAEFYISVCFGAGPSFIFGCISNQLFGNSISGLIILASTVSVNFAVLIILLFLFRKEKKTSVKEENSFNAEVFVNSVISGGRSIFNICAMIVFFSVCICILRSSGVISLISGILSRFTGIDGNICIKMLESILEVTNISTLEKNNYTMLPFICSAVSFGGICVILQIKTVISHKLSMLPFIAVRTACAVSSGILCRIFMPFMLNSQTVSVSEIEYHTYSEASPVPSYMLAFMLVILLWSFRSRKTI